MNGKFGVVGILDGWKKGDMPGPQMVNIVLNSYTSAYDGSIAITHDLATEGEVDHAVDQLIKDLESTRKKAKEKIKKTNERIHSSFNEK